MLRQYNKTNIPYPSWTNEYRKEYDKLRYEMIKNSVRPYVKSGDYTKEKLEKEKLEKEQEFYKHPITDKPTEDILYEDKYYIFLKDKIYSKSQFKYIKVYKTKSASYSHILKSSYRDIPNMKMVKNYVYYFF